MRWTGNPDTDLVLSLVDDSGTVILGQVIKDGEQPAAWNAYEYVTGNGAGCRLGPTELRTGRTFYIAMDLEEAQSAVSLKVKERKLQ